MRALVQRVTRASVSVGGQAVGSIGQGLVVLLGVADGDTEKDADYLAQKTVNLRIFSYQEGKFNLSALEIHGELLVVSQFTLLADTRKGRRPSFIEAAPPERARELCHRFVEQAGGTGLRVATCKFQEHMLVEIHNDGPVTIMLDNREKFESSGN